MIANLLHVIKKICVSENNPVDVKKYLGCFLTFEIKSSKVSHRSLKVFGKSSEVFESLSASQL